MTRLPSPELNPRTLAERIRDHGRETQLFLNSVIVSVAVANAAYVFALLLGSGISCLLWLPFMLGSFGLVLVTFAGPFSTSLLIVYVPDWRDSVLPLLQAMTVFLMFSTLIPSGSRLPLLTDWYVVVGAHALIGALWISTLASKIRASNYDASLREMLEGHLVTLRVTGLAATTCGAFWLIVWLAIRLWLAPARSELLRFQPLLGLLALAIAVAVLAGVESDRHKFVDMANAYFESSGP